MIGRYELGDKIGLNRHYEVYKAREVDTGRPIVIKTNKDGDSHSGSILKKEYQLLSLLDSERILKPLALIEEDKTYLVLEYLGLKNLGILIDEKVLDLPEMLDIALQLFKAIDDIHRQGILHLDINPSNIFWNRDKSHLTLFDFNAAQQVTYLEPEFHGFRKLLGTLEYISPEQTGRTNRLVDYRADYYSAGITLYQMFTGQLPFRDKDPLELIYSHLSSLPASPSEIAENIPPRMSRVIMKLIAKDESDRYQSAFGVCRDIEDIKDNPGLTGQWIPGSYDHTGRLNLPQKIYGRKKEIDFLESTYEQVCSGMGAVTFIGGYSGIGKTSLVKELLRKISRKSGFFLSGKYEQFRRGIPYSAIFSVLDSYLSSLMSLDQETIAEIGLRFREKLGDSAGVLVQWYPKLEWLLGDRGKVESLRGLEASNRFSHAADAFFRLMASPDRPLVVFLDDAQWIDTASVVLIKNILDSGNIPYIYLIASYRSNEIGPDHSLHLLLSKAKNQHKIELGPLGPDEIKEYINDCFDDLSDSKLLHEVVMRKTAGNMFFLKKLLVAFYESSAVTFDRETNRWIVDQAIDGFPIADNIAELLADLIQMNKTDFIGMLQAASCFGSTFHLSDLRRVTDLSEEESNLPVKIAVREQILVSLGPDLYKFSHDQIQAAASGLLSRQRRSEIHEKIASVKTIDWLEGGDGELALEIADHLLQISSIRDSNLDLSRCRDILVVAGENASSSIAYAEALLYYRLAYELSGDDSWDRDYEKTLDLLNRLMLVSYQLDDSDRVQKFFSLVEEHAKVPSHLGPALDIEIQMLMARQEYVKGIEASVEALKLLEAEIEYPVNPEGHGEVFALVAKLLENQSHDSLMQWKTMTEEKHLVVMRILSSIIPITFNLDPNLLVRSVLKMMELSMKEGFSIYTPFAFCMYGILLSDALKQIDSGVQYGKLALDLLHKMNLGGEYARTGYMTLLHILHLDIRLRQLIEMTEKAYLKGLENGDVTFTGFSGHGICYSRYIAGYELGETLRLFDSYTGSLRKLGQGTPAMYQDIYRQVILNLMEENDEPWHISGEIFNEDLMLPEFQEQKHKTALFVLYFHKMQLAYLFGLYEKAREYSLVFKGNLDGGAGLMHIPIYYQYACLIHLKLEPENREDQEFQSNLALLESFSQRVNYTHRVEIVRAEVARSEGRKEVRELYEKAIDSARAEGFLQDEALARELFSDYYLQSRNFELSDYYYRTAISCYRRWGAVTKVNHLERLQLEPHYKTASQTIFRVGSLTSDGDFLAGADMQTILDASSSLSKNIILKDLMAELLRILIRNAGADRASILVFLEKGLVMKADYDGNNDVTVGKYESSSAIGDLPLSVINKSYNSSSVVLLNNALKDETFQNDPRISERRIKSLLCFPIIHQDRVSSLIYLENKQTEKVFSPKRVRFLTLLSSQIAVSLENALVYQHMEDLVSLRTSELEKMNEELTKISLTDKLTGLSNRHRIHQALQAEIDKYHRYGRFFSLIIIDIDHFKNINDTYGHNTGDKVLKSFAQILRDDIRRTDEAGRWGGEEFIILCPEISIAEAVKLAEKLRLSVMNQKDLSVYSCTASFGVSEINGGDSLDSLINRADKALYNAKKSGRNRVIAGE